MAGEGSELIDLIVDIADDDVAATVIERYGGSRVCVPGRFVEPDNWLAEIVGVDTASTIFRAFHGPVAFGHCAGFVLTLPLAEKSSKEKNRREVCRRLKLGQSTDRIAREVGVHRRTVQRYRADLKRLARQNAASRTEGPSKC